MAIPTNIWVRNPTGGGGLGLPFAAISWTFENTFWDTVMGKFKFWKDGSLKKNANTIKQPGTTILITFQNMPSTNYTRTIQKVISVIQKLISWLCKSWPHGTKKYLWCIFFFFDRLFSMSNELTDSAI